MDVFKDRPAEIFPFEVGCDEFTHGGRCELIGAIPFPDGSGWMDVTTTATSVTFTVDDDTYFDGRGSTIKFSIVDAQETLGQEGYALRREANATDVNVFAAVTVYYGGASLPWHMQAVRLRDAVLRESGGG
ncbi:hypothetical protein [Agromyces silvae]|uniref:hypothetical protein n=1 Tax=Agromyces silvae TaxID=3388266 RepID=UPI00280B172E|nr:hypothetical protein [Agromyces protaetiae]